MIQKHKNLTKYIGQGVVYAPKDGRPQKLTIIAVRPSADVNGLHPLFDLNDLGRSTPHARFEYKWYCPSYRDVKDIDLYDNMMSYARDHVKWTEKRLEIEKNSIEYTQSRIKKMTESLNEKCQGRFVDLMEKYSKKGGGISCMKDFLEDSRKLEDWFKKEQKDIESQKESLEKMKQNLKRMKEEFDRLHRKERSRDIRREWTKSHPAKG